MEIAGYLAALVIGISLGMIGGGGSILTIPVLVYLFHLPPTEATGYSLCIVGFSCFAGAFKYFRRGNINFRAAFLFGITSILTVLLVRKFLLPVIPEMIFQSASFTLTRSLLNMVVFAIVMIVAAVHMLRSEPLLESDVSVSTIPTIKAMWRGIEVGLLTGLLGAGGGFIVIPVLLFSFRLTMKDAIGTSLLIIAMNTISGFVGDVIDGHVYHLQLLIPLTVLAVSGTFIGRRLGESVPADRLKKYFGWFILVMGCMIIIKELFFSQ